MGPKRKAIQIMGPADIEEAPSRLGERLNARLSSVAIQTCFLIPSFTNLRRSFLSRFGTLRNVGLMGAYEDADWDSTLLQFKQRGSASVDRLNQQSLREGSG